MAKLEKFTIVQNNVTHTFEIPDNWTVSQIESLLTESGVTFDQNTEIIQAFTSYENVGQQYPNLPDWVKTVSADEAAQYIHDNVLNGFEDQAAIDAYIDNQFSGVTTFAQFAPVAINMFKLIAGQLLMFRGLFEIVAKLLMLIRDLIIKYRQNNA